LLKLQILQHARELRPKILLVMQWNEWAGAPDGNKNAFTDDYNLSVRATQVFQVLRIDNSGFAKTG
jgi:hypothetical protein